MISLDELKCLISKYYDNTCEIISGLSVRRKSTFRVNKIKSSQEEIEGVLNSLNIKYSKLAFSNEAFIIEDQVNLSDLDIVKEGKVYLQSLSSQIPVLYMDLSQSNDILDMCAAPGGKTSQIASLTLNQKNIMACESNKIRSERLKYNLSLQGASKANVLVTDARKLDSFFRFDTILLDAPCSGSGTININNLRDLKSFSLDLVKNSSKTQKELLKKAIEVLKPGHTMVYSTCSILKCENEEVLKTVLNKNVVIEPISIDIDPKYLLKSDIDGVLTFAPSELYEGFFVAKIKKLG